MVYLQLFVEFFKAGLLAIGGGLATLPFLKEIAQTHDWFTVSQLTDMLAVSESTPGPIGINMSTYAGFHAAGVPGAVLATLSLVLPSYIVILIVSGFMERFRSSKLVDNVFYGIRPCTTGLIAGAMFEVFLQSLFNLNLFAQTGNPVDLFQLLPTILFIAALIIVFRFPKLHPICIIIGGAVFGILFGL